jgi:cyclophilin family peptidyl-prolyl cis-trans isomerase
MPDAQDRARAGLAVARIVVTSTVLLSLTVPAVAQEPPASRQAVVETTSGTFIIDLLADAAPNHVDHFVSVAEKGEYEGTIFHRVVRFGMVQGGDPITRDPAKTSLYGTGGLNAVKDEAKAERMTAGSVAAVTIPGRADSAGSQFFIVIVDQPALDGQYTVFGRVNEGMEVLQAISAVPADAEGRATERVEIERVTIRATPPPEPEPFSTETDAELSAYRAVLETSMGEITLELMADRAPGHVRQFLRLARAGVYDGMSVHRVAPGFVVQTGALSTRATPLTPRQQKLVVNLQPEFNDTRHVAGIVSMARGDDPASATTSFFIVLGDAPALDGVYTVFGRVLSGMEVVREMEKVARNGETPVTRVDLETIRIEGP